MRFFLFLLIHVVCGFTAHQARMARKILLKRSCIPPFARIVDAVLKDEVAFTATDGLTVFIDSAKFENAPNSWHNVLVHESSHLCGAHHNDGALGMAYHVSVWTNGSVMDDGRRMAIPT